MFPGTFNLLGRRQPKYITISPSVSTQAEAWKDTSGFVFYQTRGLVLNSLYTVSLVSHHCFQNIIWLLCHCTQMFPVQTVFKYTPKHKFKANVLPLSWTLSFQRAFSLLFLKQFVDRNKRTFGQQYKS